MSADAAGLRPDFPGFGVASGGGGGGLGAAGGQHRHDQGVRRAQGVEQVRLGGAQRGAVQRQRASTGLPFMRTLSLWVFPAAAWSAGPC
ncbi:hypothetical protein [Nocardia cyriacigeorgica]|uniref:hypothetical protein n=1 Tax=Nocardia cyriacigeorgica TaxID=135487 RepID=UPI00245910A6|nr:hypothetical protein [Nocardia cyriacigeorgica]